MLILICIVVLICRKLLTTRNVKCTSLNVEICLVWPVLTDLGTKELRCKPCMVNLGRCGVVCNALDDPYTMIFDLSDRYMFQIN